MQSRVGFVAVFALIALVATLWLALSSLGDDSGTPELALGHEQPEVAEGAIVQALEPPPIIPAPPREALPAAPEEPAPPASEREALEAKIREFLAHQDPALEIGGDITGRLLSESGAWPDDELPARGEIVIDLVSEADHSANWRGTLRVAKDEHGENQITFAFKDVPVGQYELTLSSLSSFAWTPKSFFISPPATDLEFMRYDKDSGAPLTFRVFDSETQEELEEYSTWLLNQTESVENGVLMHAGPLDADAFPVDARFRWSLAAAGYAPYFGNEASFRLDPESESRVAEVYLERGFGTLLVVLGPDPTVRPIATAAVVVNGEVLGQTRSDGSFWIQAPAMPESIEIRYRDWGAARDPLDPRLVSGLERRGHVTAILIRPPE